MKDKFKRLLGLVLALIMILGYMPTNLNTAHAAEGDVVINNTNFPDENFKIYVSRCFDKDNNGVLSKSECEEVKKLEINELDIETIKGIQHFTNLEELYCYKNKLAYADLRKNTKIIKLFMSDNKLLGDIDLSQNTQLQDLDLSNNELHKIDLSQNKSLKILYISNNHLEKLDLKNNAELTNIVCSNNEISELDISENKKLIMINCGSNKLTSFDVSNNSLLQRLDLDDNTSLESINLATLNSLKTLNCGWCKLTKLDISGCKALTALDCRDNKIDRLDTSNNASLENLICSNNALTGLFTGLTTSIKFLNCSNNKLTDINLDNLSNLEKLYVSNNKLRYLDIKNKDNLTNLNCSNNELTSLNIQHNGNSTLNVDCSVNPMIKLSYAGKVSVSSYDPVYSIEIPRGTSEIPATKVEQMLNMQNVIGNFTALTKNGSNYDWIEDSKITFKYKLSEQPELIANNAEIKIIKAQNPALDNAEKLVNILDLNRTYKNYYIAKGAVDKLAKGSGKFKLKDRLGRIIGYLNLKIVVVPDPTDPGQVPEFRVRITFDAGEGNTIDGTNRYKYIDVQENISWTDAKVTEQIPSEAKYQDATKVFDKWNEKVPTTGKVEAKTFTATYKNKAKTKEVTDLESPVPQGYARLTFNAGEGTVNGKAKVAIDVLKDTEWTDTEVTAKFPTTADYKDNTKTFEKWEGIETTGKITEDKVINAKYKAKDFDSAHVKSISVKTQPTNSSYTVGEKLNLAGLVVTLKDNNEIEKDVAFEQFGDYGITTSPANGADLSLNDNGKPVIISKGNLQDETKNLTVKAKEFTLTVDDTENGISELTEANGTAGKYKEKTEISFKVAAQANKTVKVEKTVGQNTEELQATNDLYKFTITADTKIKVSYKDEPVVPAVEEYTLTVEDTENGISELTGSAESSRALGHSLDLLKKAKKVHCITARHYLQESEAETIGRIDNYLDLHGIKATFDTVDAKGKVPGQILLENAENGNFDLIVAGMSDDNGIREVFLIGTAHYFLQNTKIPVMM